jgi:hypothetical protein
MLDGQNGPCMGMEPLISVSASGKASAVEGTHAGGGWEQLAARRTDGCQGPWKSRAQSPTIGYRGNPDSQLRYGAPVKKGDRAKYVCLPVSMGRSFVRSGIS